MRRTVILLAASLHGCVVPLPVDPFACDDADADGRCDEEDLCPDDPLDDADGDGVCAPTDACPEGDDHLDADADAVPDGCDVCPGVADMDADADGQCDTSDPCPDDPTNACAETIWIGIQADVFWEDIDWSVRNGADGVLAQGAFRSAGDGYFQEVLVASEAESCVVVEDKQGDGGSRGLVFSLKRQLKLAEWEGSDYASTQELCFTPGDGTSFTPPKQNVWLNAGQCRVEVKVFTGLYPAEIGWRLESYEGRVIDEVRSGTFNTASRVETRTLTLTDGDYRFFQLDAAGDGWTGRNDTATFDVLRVVDNATLATGVLQSGFQGSITFVLDCP